MKFSFFKTVGMLMVASLPFNGANAQAKINLKLLTLPADKSFKWIKWSEASEAIKASTKLVPTWEGSLFDLITDHINNLECDVQVALMDLNNNGIYGIAVNAAGRDCCGSRGCTYAFFEDGGILTSELGTDYEVKPALNGIISSAGLKFSLIVNKYCKTADQDKLKAHFSYSK